MLSLGTVENLYPLGRVYHSAPQKKADMCRPNIRNAAIYSRKPPADRGSQPPDDRTYSAEVTVFPRNLPLHRILRLFLLNTRSIIIQDLPLIVKTIFYFFNKFLKLFSVKMPSAAAPHTPPPRSPRHPRILMDRPGEIRSRLIARSVSPIFNSIGDEHSGVFRAFASRSKGSPGAALLFAVTAPYTAPPLPELLLDQMRGCLGSYLTV